MQKVKQQPAPPAPAENYELTYRGNVILTGKSKADCTGEKFRLINTGSYLKVHFSINEITAK